MKTKTIATALLMAVAAISVVAALATITSLTSLTSSEQHQGPVQMAFAHGSTTGGMAHAKHGHENNDDNGG